MRTNHRPALLSRASVLLVLALLLAACGGEQQASVTAEDGDPADAAGDVVEVESVAWDMAAFLPEDTGQGRAYARWMEELQSRSGGAVEITPFWSGELLGPQDIKTGLQDGRVQLGNLSYAYTPNDFPLTQMVEIPFLGENLGAQVTAMNALYAENEEFRAEWEDQGIKVLSFVPIAPSLTGATEQVDSVDWFESRDVRAAGFFVQALEAVGANPAAIPVGEIYEAMQRGTIDAYGGMILDVIPSTGLHEVGPHIHDARLGHYAITTWGMAMETYEALSPELRALVDEVSAEFPQWVVETTSQAEDDACEVILEEGGSVSIFPEAETERWREAIGDAPRQAWEERAAEAGVSDPAAMYDQFVAFYEEAAEGEFADYVSGVSRCVEVQAG